MRQGWLSHSTSGKIETQRRETWSLETQLSLCTVVGSEAGCVCVCVCFQRGRKIVPGGFCRAPAQQSCDSIKIIIKESPGSPVVKDTLSNAEDTGSTLGWGTKIPQATGQLRRTRKAFTPQQGPSTAKKKKTHYNKLINFKNSFSPLYSTYQGPFTVY